LEAYGIQDVHIETVPVLTNMPVRRVVEIVYPDHPSLPGLAHGAGMLSLLFFCSSILC
jgi:hypothetical protein